MMFFYCLWCDAQVNLDLSRPAAMQHASDCELGNLMRTGMSREQAVRDLEARHG